jgi:hypothetical protein
MRKFKNNGYFFGNDKIEVVNHFGKFEYRLDTLPFNIDGFSYLLTKDYFFLGFFVEATFGLKGGFSISTLDFLIDNLKDVFTIGASFFIIC